MHKTVADLIEVLKRCPDSTRVGKVSWEQTGMTFCELDLPFAEYLRRQPHVVTVEFLTNVEDA